MILDKKREWTLEPESGFGEKQVSNGYLQVKKNSRIFFIRITDK